MFKSAWMQNLVPSFCGAQDKEGFRAEPILPHFLTLKKERVLEELPNIKKQTFPENEYHIPHLCAVCKNNCRKAVSDMKTFVQQKTIHIIQIHFHHKTSIIYLFRNKKHHENFDLIGEMLIFLKYNPAPVCTAL